MMRATRRAHANDGGQLAGAGVQVARAGLHCLDVQQVGHDAAACIRLRLCHGLQAHAMLVVLCACVLWLIELGGEMRSHCALRTPISPYRQNQRLCTLSVGDLD